MQFQIGDVFQVYLEFCEKIKSFFEKLLRSDICFEFVCHSFFSTQLYPKTNKNYEQLWKWKIQTPRVFWKRISIFLHLEKKAINLLVLHQLYSKGHAKLPGYSSSMAVYVDIQKKVISDQMMWFFDHFRPFLSQKWPFSGFKAKKFNS